MLPNMVYKDIIEVYFVKYNAKLTIRQPNQNNKMSEVVEGA